MSRRLILLVTVAVAVGGCIWWFAASSHTEHPQFRDQAPDSADVLIGDELIGTITNTGDLVSLLRRGEWIPPHPCAARGQFVLHYGTDSVRVSFYPGHSDSEYEFAVGGKGYGIARKPLMDILEAAGIDLARIPQQ